MPRGVRRKEGEDFSKATIERVISLLEADKPITKKSACEMLNITYNTTRLNKVIEEYKTTQEHAKRRRTAIRGTPLTDQEKAYIISSYLEDVSLTDISDSSFRSINVIKNILKTYGIPLREATVNYESVFLPDISIKEDYNSGDLVFSAKYNAPAKIRSYIDNGIYSIWLYGRHQQWAYQPYWELGSLVKVQKELGVDIDDFPHEEYVRLINEGLTKAKKMKNVQK